MPLVFRTTENNEVSIPYSNILSVEAYTPPPIAIAPGRFISAQVTPEVTLTTRDHRIFNIHPDHAFQVCTQLSEYYAHTVPEEEPIFEL